MKQFLQGMYCATNMMQLCRCHCIVPTE